VGPIVGVLAGITLGYVLGAIPFGVVIARLAGGADPRTVGSLRTGATNTVRALGPGWGLVVGLLDVAKGLVAAAAGAAIGSAVGLLPEWLAAGSCVAAVIGHIRSVFIGFRGGRGVATAAGGFLVLVPLALLIVIPVIGAVVAVTRYVSMGSIAGAVSAPLVVAALSNNGLASGADIAYSALVGVLVVLAHADNIARLRAGTERKIGDPRPAEPQPGEPQPGDMP
jgi:glycerol-3-phosphate acyltransferase PlsY